MKWRLIQHGSLDPYLNMAIDEALFLGSGPPTLRFYEWEGPSITIGYFQSFSDVSKLAEDRPVVRRLTGGGAILHQDDMTFSLTFPREQLGLGQARETFCEINRALVEGFRHLGVEAECGPPTMRGTERGNTPGPALCFQRATETDLVVKGAKLLGTAQRRSGQRGLIQGSLPLANRSEPTLESILGREIPVEKVYAAFSSGFTETLDTQWVEGDLTGAEKTVAEDLLETRYRLDSWNKKR